MDLFRIRPSEDVLTIDLPDGRVADWYGFVRGSDEKEVHNPYLPEDRYYGTTRNPRTMVKGIMSSGGRMDDEDAKRLTYRSRPLCFDVEGERFSPIEVISALPARSYDDFAHYLRFLRAQWQIFEGVFGALTPKRVQDEISRGYTLKGHQTWHDPQGSWMLWEQGDKRVIEVDYFWSEFDKYAFILYHEIVHAVAHSCGCDPIADKKARERCVDFAAARALDDFPCLGEAARRIFDTVVKEKYVYTPLPAHIFSRRP